MDLVGLSAVAKLAIGAILLCFGCRLFWLFVALSGFLIVFRYIPMLIPDQAVWIQFGVAVIAGIAGGLLAVGMQYYAAALGGFFAGAYFAAVITTTTGDPAMYWPQILGGVVGAVLMLRFLDPTLIVLSSLVGAGIIVETLSIAGHLAFASLVVITLIGIAIQFALSRMRGRAA